MSSASSPRKRQSPITKGRRAPETAEERPRSALPTVTDVVAGVADGDLVDLLRFWSGSRTKAPMQEELVRRRVVDLMGDPSIIDDRVEKLGRKLGAIFNLHLGARGYQLSRTELLNAKGLAYLSTYDLEASLEVLLRRGLLVMSERTVTADADVVEQCTRAPVDLAESLLRKRRGKERGIFDTLTLRGHLDRLYSEPSRAKRTPPGRVREIYKMYVGEPNCVARIQRLPEGLRALIEKTVLEFGGVLPRGLFERMETELPHWNGPRWSKILEESLVGTVERLDLSRFGIRHTDETLLVFNEVALAWLRKIAVPGDPDAPHDMCSIGVDLSSNITRFISYIIEHSVRFTTKGEIFKTTEKRIIQELIPNPGRELAREEVLSFIYAFARNEKLIESTGERTFTLTRVGREWEPLKLEQKLERLLEFCLEERRESGEHYHQARMRRILISMLKRVEPGVWYDIMYVPFLARNAYLSSIDELDVEEYFHDRLQSGQYKPSEDLQRMAWNLVRWVRQRLYLIGVIDLGYDVAGRPVALRLSTLGARMLGVLQEEPDAAPRVGNLVVTPDFGVVLFPTGDDAELTHDLDRFCERGSFSNLLQFKITEKTVVRALHEGMRLRRICRTLEQNSRTPVPQNVLYSIRDWAANAGLLTLADDYIVRAVNGETLRRFQSDPGVRPYLREVSLDHLRLRDEFSLRRTQSLLRELGYLVELDG